MVGATAEKTLVRTYKEKIKEDLKNQIEAGNDFFVAHYRGLKSSEICKLRKDLAKFGAKVSVVQNRLTRAVLDEFKLDKILQAVDGPTAFIFGINDPAAISKSLVTFAKENEKLDLEVAYIEKRVLDKSGIKELSDLPPREVLIARVIAGIKTPITGLHGVLFGNIRKFVYALDAIAKKKQE